MNIDTEKIRKYFLGDMPETDLEAIELAMIADPDLEAEFISVENDLVEDFINGDLSDNDRQLFLKNYLVTDERKKNIETTAMLINYSQKRSTKTESVQATETFFERLKKLFGGTPALAYATASVILIVVIGGYFLFSYVKHNELQRYYAAANQQDLGDLTAYSKPPTLSAQEGNLRSGGALPKVPASADDIFARLLLPPEVKGNSFSVKLLQDKSSLIELNNIGAYENAGGSRELRLILPGKNMAKGKYTVEAIPDDLPGSKLNFYFEVE